jgi:hypothetical protein
MRWASSSTTKGHVYHVYPSESLDATTNDAFLETPATNQPRQAARASGPNLVTNAAYF